MSTNANTIMLTSNFRLEEHLASAALTPGHLIELISTNKVRKHATAKGFAEVMFALEDALQGRPISTAYAADELVQCGIAGRGAIVQAWLEPGNNYAIGDKLQSAGDGTLQENSGTADLQTIAVLLEAVDLSASGAVATRANVRIL